MGSNPTDSTSSVVITTVQYLAVHVERGYELKMHIVSVGVRSELSQHCSAAIDELIKSPHSHCGDSGFESQ